MKLQTDFKSVKIIYVLWLLLLLLRRPPPGRGGGRRRAGRVATVVAAMVGGVASVRVAAMRRMRVRRLRRRAGVLWRAQRLLAGGGVGVAGGHHGRGHGLLRSRKHLQGTRKRNDMLSTVTMEPGRTIIGGPMGLT